jgi:hypothetical protein
MNYLDNLVKTDIYLYKKGHTNILFIGGCRSFCYQIYFEELCKNQEWFLNAQFGTSVIGVHIIDLCKRNKTENMAYVIENADIIICEQVRNYNILNTSKKCDDNIFKNFNIKENCKIINIPNLELRYYKNDISFNHIDEIAILKKQNLTNFINSCKKYNFKELADYVSININKRRLFIQHNHPSNCLILEFFKELIKIVFQQNIQDNVLNILNDIKIFDTDYINRTIIDNYDYICGLEDNIV